MRRERGRSRTALTIAPRPRCGKLPAGCVSRKLFTPAARVSAVLCAGVCVLWVRSYSAFDSAGFACQPPATVTAVRTDVQFTFWLPTTTSRRHPPRVSNTEWLSNQSASYMFGNVPATSRVS
jgi:hypothetical protein